MDTQQQKQQTSAAAAQNLQQPTTMRLHADSRKCSACNHSNELEALYCEECGKALQTAKCPHCGSTTEPGDDICERCGTWQLAGQCMFCYAPLEDDDLFCSECGNPVEGVVCPQCGNRGCFDFCAACSIPLTETAKLMLQDATEDPNIKGLVLLIENFSLNAHPSANPSCSPSTADTTRKKAFNASQKADMAALEDYLARLRKQRNLEATMPETISLFSQEQRESIGRLNDQIVMEKERKRLETERLRAEVNNLLQSYSDKIFRTSQEARRFFSTIKAAVSKEALNMLNNYELVWKCNAYNRWHPNETHCAKPHLGGNWLFVPGPIDWK
jgi:hypothetical protein